MNSVDRQILNIIQREGRVSVKKIAEQCFISSPSASIRLQKLESRGLIKSYSADVDYHLLGYAIKSYVHIDVNAKNKFKFYHYIEKIRNVLECDCITGDYSMRLKVLFKTMAELDQFVNDLQQFGDTHTNVVFSTAVGPRPLMLECKEKRLDSRI